MSIPVIRDGKVTGYVVTEMSFAVHTVERRRGGGGADTLPGRCRLPHAVPECRGGFLASQAAGPEGDRRGGEEGSQRPASAATPCRTFWSPASTSSPATRSVPTGSSRSTDAEACRDERPPAAGSTSQQRRMAQETAALLASLIRNGPASGDMMAPDEFEQASAQSRRLVSAGAARRA